MKKMVDDSGREAFQQTVRQYYHKHGRHDLPWRMGRNPYHIVVSELMLQQTQVNRVIPKYQEFLQHFPTVQELAAVSLGDVLRTWSGLGYNRRAKFLWQAAGQVVQEYNGVFPSNKHELIKLPGIGSNTAGAILAYAYNQPTVFVETNIRTVFLHHFFHDQTDVPDAAVLELVAATLDTENSREWYWALMDYGTCLKQTIGNPNTRSKGYARQSAFHGSRRQVRGQVLRLLGDRPYTVNQLRKEVNDNRLAGVLEDLVREQLIRQQGKIYHL